MSVAHIIVPRASLGGRRIIMWTRRYSRLHQRHHLRYYTLFRWKKNLSFGGIAIKLSNYQSTIKPRPEDCMIDTTYLMAREGVGGVGVMRVHVGDSTDTTVGEVSRDP